MFAALREALPDDYTVLHHVQWLQRRPGEGARDGEADFLIVHNDRGGLTIEVKGGDVQYDAKRGQWLSGSESGQEHVITDPFYQAQTSAHALHRYLKSRPGWQETWGPLGHAVAFPDGVLASPPLPHVDPSLVMDALVVHAPSMLRARVDEIFEVWSGPRWKATATGTRMVIDALAHDLSIRQPLGVAVDAADRAILTLSDRQYGVLRTIGSSRRVAISGPAGSGKTLLAVEKARRLSEQGFRVLLTCFNRPLADFLRDSLGPVANLTVMSFHQLCRSVVDQARMPLPPGQPDPGWWRSLELLFEQATASIGAMFDAIVVDEGQDFEERWWLPLLTLLEDPDRGILYVFYDSNQAIYSRPAGLPDGMVPAHLWENWRNSTPIFLAVQAFYRGEEEVVSCGPDGPRVETVTTAPQQLRPDLSRVLHRVLVEGRVDPSDVVVLTPRSVERSQVAGTVGSYRLTPTPHGKNEVKLSSIFRFKGLDAKVVIVCEVDRHADEAFVQLMYVACSRARSLLVVILSDSTAR